MRIGLRKIHAVIFLTAVVLTVLGLGELRIRWAEIPSALNQAPAATPVLEDFRGRPFSSPAADFARDARPARLAEIGPSLITATVAIEDHRFFRHPGVDVIAMSGAALRNVWNRKIISGASTITQQTVKLGVGRTRRTMDAKWREGFAALRLDREWSKEKILEAYFNRLDYGNRRIGPIAAAFAYFGKPPCALTFAEAVYLAGIPQSPTRLNPWKNPQQTLARYRRNIQRMERQHLVPEGISAQTLLEAPPSPGRFGMVTEAPHFVREAFARMPAGARRTTLDLDLQGVVGRIVEAAKSEREEIGASACGVVVIDNATGGVRSMVSVAEPRHRDINLTTMRRSVGSTLKPFLYLEAISNKTLTAATILPDTEEAIRSTYEDYDPQNYNHRFLGPVRVREALGNSLNVPAVVTLSRLGARSTFARLTAWGLEFGDVFDAYGAGFVLGNAEASLLDLAGAYASLARGGRAWRATLLVGEPTHPTNCATPAACAILTDILTDPHARRRAFGDHSALDTGARVAVKTGTSSGFRDGWCVGFTREHTVAVWTGNPDGSPMNAALSVRSAAPVWNAVVSYLLAHGDSPVPEPREDLGLEKCLIASETGFLPRPGEASLTEWFLPGTAPTRNASECYEQREGREVQVLPEEFAGWCASPQNRIGAVTGHPEFKILFPKDGAVFVFNPNLPHSQQLLIPTSTDPYCEWFANGEKLSFARIPLTPGQWTLTAKSGSRLQSATFRVE